MNAFLLLFSSENEALGRGGALADNGWNVVVTGPNDGIEILDGDDEIATSAKGWTVFASKERLLEPDTR